VLDKGEGIASEPLRILEDKKCFKYQGYGHFQLDCPNKRTFTVREVEKILIIEEVTSEEEAKDKDQTLITLDVGELLLIWRSLHV